MRFFLFFYCFSFLVHGENFLQQYKEIACRDFLLPHLTIKIDDEEVRRQEAFFPGSMQIMAAFKKALFSFINDGSDNESPLSIALDLCGKEIDVDCQKRIVMDYLNDQNSVLQLLSLNDEKMMPIYGEKHDNQWLFLLKIPHLSDHLYWAIVSRNGDTVYNYGFN